MRHQGEHRNSAWKTQELRLENTGTAPWEHRNSAWNRCIFSTCQTIRSIGNKKKIWNNMKIMSNKHISKHVQMLPNDWQYQEMHSMYNTVNPALCLDMYRDLLLDRRLFDQKDLVSWKKKVPFSMAIRKAELMHDCFPEHSRMGTARIK